MSRISQLLTSKLELELENCLEQIKGGNSNLDESDLNIITNCMAAVNKANIPISKQEVCDKILRCTTKTFDNYVDLGLLPKGKKRYGFKELSWLLIFLILI